MVLKTNKRYSAKINLDIVQSIANNQAVANKFKEVGFADVVVVGGGRQRVAVGRWPGATREVEIPAQVTEVKEL